MSIETKIIRDETIDIIESSAKGKGISTGEEALNILQNKKVKGITREAALYVRARELVKQEKASRWPK